MAQEQRRFDQAETHYCTALELFIEFNDRHNQTTTDSQLGALLNRAGRSDEAVEYSVSAYVHRTSNNITTEFDLGQLARQQVAVDTRFVARLRDFVNEATCDKIIHAVAGQPAAD